MADSFMFTDLLNTENEKSVTSLPSGTIHWDNDFLIQLFDELMLKSTMVKTGLEEFSMADKFTLEIIKAEAEKRGLWESAPTGCSGACESCSGGNH